MRRLTVLLALVWACTPPPDGTSDPWSSPTTTSDPWTTEPPAVITELDPLVDLPVIADACRDPLLVVVDEGIDGDTLWVDPIEVGPSETVRLIGFDSPEVGWEDEPSECWADEAQSYTRMALQGQVVWLTFDRECEDSYDRTLAYVHTSEGDDGVFNVAAVRDGIGSVMIIEPNDGFRDELQVAEQAARQDGAGMWACQ